MGMQCINARNAGGKCNAGMVPAGGKGKSFPINLIAVENHAHEFIKDWADFMAIFTTIILLYYGKVNLTG